LKTYFNFAKFSRSSSKLRS